ncbi:hypothetical protein [uncultured Tateyamaria sp.]|uniref:calcium-binding protein n=1 Tax=uncultured Tateyamaria sp. TaxID=455651 RepID=UPI00260C8641|nr:hypothetical protein [uncultured Tateyamaria sp.]
MGPLALLALLTGTFVLGAVVDNDTSPATDDTTPEPEDPDPIIEPSDPDVPAEPDVGASFMFDETTNAVSIDVGEDETGRIASIIYVDTEDNEENFVETYEARFYLVPEGTDLTDADFEARSDIPGQQEYGGSPFNYQLEDFEAFFGLELLGTVPLDVPENGGILPEPGTMRSVLPDIAANAEVAVHYLEANTDGDDLITFLNEDYVITRGGVTEQVVTEDTTGTNGNDWITTGAENLTLDGGDGNDTLVADHAGTTLIGGAGNDIFEGVFAERGAGFSLLDGSEPGIVIDAGDGDDNVRTSNAIVDAGTGDDSVRLFGGEVRGGDGNDVLMSSGPGETSLFGDNGNDRLTIGGAGSEAFGGAGDDFLSTTGNAGAVAYGDAGNDTLQLSAGSAGFGGEGDDLFNLYSFYDDEDGPTTITGGAGADTINAQVRNAFGTPEAIYAEITDFDTTEDVLQVGSFSGVGITNIDIEQNADAGVTDIRISYVDTGNTGPGTAIIRIDGLSDITEDQIIIVS